MKKALSLIIMSLVLVSVSSATVHPLIGKWKFSYVIDGTRFYDYVTITTVNTTTKKVRGHVTGLPGNKLTGYYKGNMVFIIDSWGDWLDGYYFTFQGTTPLKKYLNIFNISDNLETDWRQLWATKLSSSIASTEIMTLSEVLNEISLKKQALLRERMTARPLVPEPPDIP